MVSGNSAEVRLVLFVGFLFSQVNRSGVDAKPQAGRFRAVFEDVPQMSIAAAADCFGADHAMARITLQFDILRINGLPIARPTRTGMIFCFGAEERLAAADANVRSLRLRVLILAAERWLSSLLPRDVELLLSQLCLPIGIALSNFLAHVN